MSQVAQPHRSGSSSMPKIWFITGASRGIGGLVAEEALRRGDNVVATARDTASVATRFPASENLLAVPLNVTDEAQAHGAADVAIQRYGRIDVLLNNAGFGLLGAVEEATAAEIKRFFRTNVFGLLAVTRAVLPHMRRERRGHIFNISSIGGYAASAGWGVYCSTKFAVEGLTEALALELKPLGIWATVVEPGFFRTDFLDARSLSVSGAEIADYAETAGAMRHFATRANHAQPGDPAKLARAILELVDADKPPTRMPFGSDTVRRIEAKNAFVARELAAWRELALSTDAA